MSHARDRPSHHGDRASAAAEPLPGVPASPPTAEQGFYEATLDSLPAHVAVLDGNGTILAVNAAWLAFHSENHGAEGGSGVGANYFAVCDRAADGAPSSEAAEVAAGLREIVAGTREDLVVEYPYHGPLRSRWFVLRAARFAGAGPTRVVLQHQDVTALREAEESARFRGRLLDAVDAAVIALDPEGLVTAWNRGAERLYGWTSEEALGRPGAALVAPEAAPAAVAEVRSCVRQEGRWEGEFEVQRKDGTRFPVYARNAALEGPDGLVGFVGVSVDMTDQLQADRDLRSARDYMRAVADSMGDGLCTLDELGRIVYFNPRGEELLGWTRAQLAGRDFHATLHHTRPDGTPYPADDCPLVQARRLRHAARVDDDVLVRSNGTLLAVQQVMTPFETEDGVGGFALVFTDITVRKRQEHDAARRLYDLAWIERIRDAMADGRFVLYAQPIVEVDGGRTVQHELLLRMLDVDGSVILPDAFLPVAESYGLISEIDRWVVRRSVDLAAADHAVELNVSAHSLSDPTFGDYVEAELRRSGADPALLVFELTETALLRDEQAALRFATAIKQRGCRLALDDFGTGYGGFSYLKRLPVDFLKVDIEFVRDLKSDPGSAQVVEAVVNLARGFGIRTVAEGVEDDATLVLLRDYGVDYAQGFVVGEPAPLHETIGVGEPSSA